MCNAITKLSLSALILLTACSGGSKGPDPANELFDQATQQLHAGNTAAVYTLLDSLKITFPDSVALQRRGLLLRRQAMLLDTTERLNAVNDSINIAMDEVKAMEKLIKRIDDPRLVEPFMVAAAGYNPDFLSTTGIQARIDNAGQFYIISSLQSASKHTGIELSISGETAAAGPVAYDGELNYRINGSEVITFSPIQSAAIGIFASTHRDRGATLRFTGDKPVSTKLTAKQVNAIADCYDYSQAMTRGRRLSLEREKLIRQQQLTESQIEQLGGAR